MVPSKLLFPILASSWLVGCVAPVDLRFHEVDLGPALGSLTVRWSIDDSRDPPVCSTYRVNALELVVYDGSGAEFTRENASCTAFGATVTLEEGRYTAEATLIDQVSNARSVTQPLDAIDIISDTDLAIDVDFPLGSLL